MPTRTYKAPPVSAIASEIIPDVEEEATFEYPLYPEVEVQLTGEDGHTGSIMGRVARAMKAGNVDPADIDEFRIQCFSGDYSNMLRTCMLWVTVH